MRPAPAAKERNGLRPPTTGCKGSAVPLYLNMNGKRAPRDRPPADRVRAGFPGPQRCALAAGSVCGGDGTGAGELGRVVWLEESPSALPARAGAVDLSGKLSLPQVLGVLSL